MTMKKYICIAIALVIVLLSGCSVPLFEPQTGLIEIQGLEEYTNGILSADYNGESWVFLCTSFKPDETMTKDEATTEPQTSEQEEESSEEYADEAEELQGEYYYTISLVNPKNAKVKEYITVKNCPIESFEGVEFDDDGNIIAYNGYEKKCVIYSPDLKNESKVKKYKGVNDYSLLAKKNAFYDDAFSNYESFSYWYNEYDKDNRVAGYIFYDDNDNIYLANEESFSPNSGYDKRVLGMVYDEKDGSLDEIKIFDFSTSVLVNSVSAPDYGENKNSSVNISVLRDGSAFLTAFEYPKDDSEDGEDNTATHYYIWNYSLDEKNTPIEVEKQNKAAFEGKNKQLCKEFKKNYGVDIHLNEANQYTLDKDEVYSLELDATSFKLYSTLIGIKYFFGKLPDGFVKETYTGMEHIETGGIDIYIGSRIKGNPSAYANRWGEKFQITLSSYTFGIETLAHEFMHIIDARLDDYYWEEGLDTIWSDYNPKGFDYLGYQENNPEPWEKIDISKYENDFASSYAMSAATEDRADTFSSLFNSGLNSEPQKPYWYKKGTPAAKKAAFLCKSIRKAYPCMKDAPVQPWEKCISEDLKL